jgi:hypothetical protein
MRGLGIATMLSNLFAWFAEPKVRSVEDLSLRSISFRGSSHIL